MDPLTLSTTLATIVGLICNYRQEKGAREELNHQGFIEWLEYHRHEDVKRMISETYHLQTQVDELLKENHEALVTKLNGIENFLALLLSKIEGFAPMVRAIHPSIELSEMAQWILGRFSALGAELLLPVGNGTFCFIVKGSSTCGFEPDAEDAPFIEDDFTTLCQAGLLSSDFNSRGDPFYRLTRSGYAFARSFGLLERHKQLILTEQAPDA